MPSFLRERWNGIVRRLTAFGDRLASSRHRREARLRLARQEVPRSILFVCTGNICRSPYAEARLRAVLRGTELEAVKIESAGFIGPGRPADPRGSAIALARGVDLSRHQSRLIGPADAARFDLIVAMTRQHRTDLIRRFDLEPDRVVLLGDFTLQDGGPREILDPYGKPDHEFERVFDQIESAIQGLRQTLLARGP